MKAADSATIEAGTPGSLLMERAGRAVARTAIRLAGDRYGSLVVCVCGKGNNGGDGFVAARVLRTEGVGVRCLFVGDPDSVTGEAAEHRDRFVAGGGFVEPFDPARLDRSTVVIDALFGTGFRGQAEGEAARAIEAINASASTVVSIDVPSGVDAATGRAEGPSVMAHVTVAMGAEKVGTATGEGATRAGFVETVDIGIEVGDASVFLLEEADVAGVLPRREPDSHKRSAGSVGLLCGSEAMSGAAILAARGAMRMGAGYATLGVPAAIRSTIIAKLPEVLTSAVTQDAHLGTDALRNFKSVLDRADSLALGCGLGQGDDQRGLVQAVLREVPQPIVLDADGLNVLAGDTGPLQERSAPTVLTPHPAELARLLECPTESVQADRLRVAREAAESFGCVVVLKGHRSVISASDGRAVINPSGSPELATAGTGDVLTGAIAALLAAGLDAFEAAWAAAFVHGVAGSIAGERVGRSGVVAWDVAEALPAAMTATGGAWE
jgi:NAD(P)H-hydrate epimerase